MKDIHEYIKEAFITKTNIKQLTKDGANKDVWYLIPTLWRSSGGDSLTKDMFNDIQEFSTYDELIDILTNSKYTPALVREHIEGAYISDIETVETLDDDLYNLAPNEYKESFKDSYLLWIYIRRPNYSVERDYLVGYVNCDSRVIKETTNKK